MKVIGTYLTFDGNCKEAMDFYKSIFGGEFDGFSTWGEAPMMENPPSEQYKHRIMHCSLPIGPFFLMASDRYPVVHKEAHADGNNTQIVLQPESREETDRLFAALSEGGTVDMPLEDQFWGSYHGSFTDKYGIKWMLESPNPTNDGKAELKRTAATLRDVAESVHKEVANLENFLANYEHNSKKAKSESTDLEVE